MNPDYLISLDSVTHFRKINNGIILDVDSEKAEVIFCNSSTVRVRISQGGSFIEKPSSSCLAVKWPAQRFDIRESKGRIILSFAELKVTIVKKPFSISIHRNDGSALLTAAKDRPFYQFQNNYFLLNRECSANDHIYGLGEKTGHLDRHGRSFTLWNKDVLAPDPDKHISDLIAESEKSPLDTDFDPYYISIPFYYRMDSQKLQAAGHFIDNPFKASFEFNNNKNHSHISISFNGGQYCEYFFAGPQIKDILEKYTEITGRMERPPLWALGYHQCRWKKYSQKELIALAQKQRSSKVPCDVLWLDIDYMDEYRVFTWNDKLFPDRAALFEKLKDMGFRVIKIVDPGIKYEQGYKIFDEAKENDLLCKCENGQIYIGQVWPGKTAFPDFSKAACRSWWGEKNAGLIEEGTAGIWNDMNEPATGSIGSSDMLFSGEDNSSLPHARYHNEYALLMAMGTVEGMLKAEENLRTFVLSRAGSPGIQRYAANWMGDNASRWEHLQMSLPMAMGLGLSGQPFVGADIGGFVEPTHAELFIRWMQCGALTPFCRNHNDDAVDQYVWSFGKGVQKICEKFIKLRYQLLPYIYTQFVKSSESGFPLQRPLVFDSQTDPACRQIDDQYLFGEDILVAPVLKAGATSRNLYLPEGEWFSPVSKKFYEGGRWLSIKAPIDTLPWFIKCGAVIPMLAKIPESTMSLDSSVLKLLCAIPEEKGVFQSELIEDDGLTFDFKRQKELRTAFTLSVKEKGVTVKSSVSGDSFAEFNRSEIEFEIYSRQKYKWQSASTKLVNKKNLCTLKNNGENFEIRGK